MKRSFWTALIICGAAASSVIVLMFLTLEWIGVKAKQIFSKHNAPEPTMSPPISDVSAKNFVITVHGTFARGAEWAQPGHKLHTEISSQLDRLRMDCSWHNFEWSGENTVADRRAAIDSLTLLLSKIFVADPYCHVVLIAHSHGGNIALKASESFFENPNLRLVTMATPFLFAQRRPFTNHLLNALPIVNGVAAAGLGVGVANLAAWWFAVSLPEYAIAAIAIMSSLPIILREVLGYGSLRKDQEDLLQTSPDISRLALARDKMLICTRVGDEADGGLKLASLASSWISRNISEVKFFPPRFALTRGGKTSVKRFWRFLAYTFNACRNFTPKELAVLVFGSMCLELLHRAVGTRTALAAATIAVNSSETPPGFWMHYQTKFSVNRSDVFLNHSQIYMDPLVLSTIADWLYSGSRSPVDAVAPIPHLPILSEFEG